MKRTHPGWLALLLPVVAFALYLFFHGLPTESPVPPGYQEDVGYPHLRWGNPSGATEDVASRDNFLMKKKYFALSYNNAKGTPNWVSWRVVGEDLGKLPRPRTFRSDDDLPPGFKKVDTDQYTGAGFDRGHMCPHSDRNSDEEANLATFVMTNVVPQSPANNEKAWAQFEEYCRSLVKEEDKELYIVSGPSGQGGEGKKGRADFIADGAVVVPKETWKVVLVLNRGGAVEASARLIAVVMPNDQTVGEDWSPYRVSVKSVEERTHYKFFDQADQAVLGPLKEKADAAPMPPPRDRGR